MAVKKTPEPLSEIDLIRALAEILSETGLTEIELERKDTKVRVARNIHVTASVAPVAASSVPSSVASAMPVAKPQPVETGPHPGTVKSPMVGTVYRASAPGSANFIEVGSEVRQGQTLLIIEAMKTMNQIPSPRAGKVIEIFVNNGQPVEYGEELAVIE